MIQGCRSCGHKSPAAVIDLGEQPEANSFPTVRDDPAAQPRWPLRVVVCRRCWLVQLDHVGPAEAAIPGPPIYDVSAMMRDHARRFVDDVLARQDGPAGTIRVVELASHGTYLAPFFAERDVPSLIVEGSPALAEAAARSGFPVLDRPFGSIIASQIVADGGAADLIADNYLLAHVVDPNEIAAGLRILLRAGGLAVLELDHLLPLVTDRRFDSVRHGHFSYWSLTALRTLLDRHGLHVVDVQPQPVYGGALRVYVAHRGDPMHPVSPSVGVLLAKEGRAGLTGMTAYARFAQGVEIRRAEIRAFLEDRRAEGRTVVGYGAPSRGSTLLNSCGVTPELLPYTVDRSPVKQGRAMPGCGVPIHAPERIFETRPDFVLLLAWDLRDEISRQLSGIHDWGGRLVAPLPRLELLP